MRTFPRTPIKPANQSASQSGSQPINQVFAHRPSIHPSHPSIYLPVPPPAASSHNDTTRSTRTYALSCCSNAHNSTNYMTMTAATPTSNHPQQQLLQLPKLMSCQINKDSALLKKALKRKEKHPFCTRHIT